MKTFSTKTEPYLCEQCKPFGYCRLAIKKLKVEEEEIKNNLQEFFKKFLMKNERMENVILCCMI